MLNWHLCTRVSLSLSLSLSLSHTLKIIQLAIYMYMYIALLCVLADWYHFICSQLEAIIRISESLAKMSLTPFALESHVDEALRLFQVSTLDAAMSGSLSGAEGFTSNDDQEEVRKIERQLKNRFPIGSNVSEQRIIQDFLKQVKGRITS